MKLKLILFLIVVSQVTLCDLAFSYSESKALLIGISQYENPSVDGLAFADEDAKSFAAILESYSHLNGITPSLLTNNQATKQNISKELKKIIKASKKKPLDRFIFFYAGHSLPDKIDKYKNDEFLIPYDGDISTENWYLTTNKVAANETLIDRSWLVRQLSSIEANSIIVVFDSCYSGIRNFSNIFVSNLGFKILNNRQEGGTRGISTKKLSGTRGGMIDGKTVSLIAASKEDQEATEYNELRHGALSYCIFEAVDDVSKDTYIDENGDISIGLMYEKIMNLFGSTELNGVKLINRHQPILISLPDENISRESRFLTVSGLKKFEPIKIEPGQGAPLKAGSLKSGSLKTDSLKAGSQTTGAQTTGSQAAETLKGGALKAEAQTTGSLKAASQKAEFLKAEPTAIMRAKLILKADIDKSLLDLKVNGESKETDDVYLNEGINRVSVYIGETNYNKDFIVNVDSNEDYVLDFGSQSLLKVLVSGVEEKIRNGFRVYLDGNELGKPPIERNDLLPGTHELTIRYKDVSKKRKIELRPDSPLKLVYKVKYLQKNFPILESVGDVVF